VHIDPGVTGAAGSVAGASGVPGHSRRRGVHVGRAADRHGRQVPRQWRRDGRPPVRPAPRCRLHRLPAGDPVGGCAVRMGARSDCARDCGQHPAAGYVGFRSLGTPHRPAGHQDHLRPGAGRRL
ncbi:MAG: hypothetical protein AVDCRST_MAG21-898, partial [uncultured Nocardioidaceae bacterium]